jgi:predicted aldo/keto reductase-like oxidoreductase
VTGEFRRGGMVYRPLGKIGMNVSLLAFGSHTDRAYKQRGGIRNVLNADGQVRRDRQISKAMDLGVKWSPSSPVNRSRGYFSRLSSPSCAIRMLFFAQP